MIVKESWLDAGCPCRMFIIFLVELIKIIEILRPFLVLLFVASCPNAVDEVNTSKDVITWIDEVHVGNEKGVHNGT